MAKLSIVVKNNIIKKTEYDKLIEKVDNIDTTGFVLKATYDTDKSDLEKKISDTAKKTDLNAKITEIESKIPCITGLVTNSALTAENKIPDVNSLVQKKQIMMQKCQIGKKITDHNHDKYTITPEFNNLAVGVFTARLAHADLITKRDFNTKLQNLHRKVTSNKTKHLLVEN